MLQNIQLRRRALLGHALVLAGAAATTGFSAEALAYAARKPKRLLGKSAFATLSAACDTLIPVTDTPGALAAKVPQTFDALLANWASPATRELVSGALVRLEAAAKSGTGKSFARLTAAERTTFLSEYDKAALQPVPPPPGAKSAHPFAPLVSVADNGWHRIKDLIITLYYSSEIGLTEELIYEHVPGEWVPSLKITPGMRPFAGTGPF
jgi:gluconate 2-dehydrogenase gamma chain